MKENSNDTPSSWVGYSLATSLFLLSIIVMTGWHFGWVSLVQIGPNTAPIQHNTALAFFLSAASLLCSKSKYRYGLYTALTLSGSAFALSFMTGLQYVTGSDYGIDNLFVDPYMQNIEAAVGHVQAKTAHAGRMAPNTALCFLLITAALLSFQIKRLHNKEWVKPFTITLICATSVLTLSLLALIGHIFKISLTYSWWSLSEMSLQTSAGFLMLSCGTILLLSRFIGMIRDHDFARCSAVTLQPLSIAVIGIFLSVVAVQSVLLNNAQQAKNFVTARTLKIAKLAQSTMENDIKALQRMQLRWKYQDGTPLDLWSKDAQAFIEHKPSFQSIAILNNDLAIQAKVERVGVVNDVTDNLKDLISLRESISFAKLYNEETNSALFSITLPLRHKSGDPDGFLFVIYSLQEEINKIMSSAKREGYHYTITDTHNNIIATNLNPLETRPWDIAQAVRFDVLGQSLSISLSYDASEYRDSWLIFLVFVAGVSISLMVANSMRKTAEIKQIAQQIENYKNRLEAVLENTVDGLITIDEKGAIQSYNKACEKMFGYSAEEALGKNIKMLMPTEYAKEHNQYIENYKRSGKAKIIGIGRVVEGQRKDGTTFPLDLSVAEVRFKKGRIFSGIVRDITQRVKDEAELHRINEELEQFAYIASHDLKAPLRGIDNLAKWIAEDLEDVLTEDASQKMELLRGRVARLEMLLEDILQYSRAGRMVDKPVEVEIETLLEQIISNLDLPEEFSVNIGENMPVLNAPHTPLHQIFSNLIGNAWKHHDKDKGHIEISVVSRGAFHEFVVKDDGPGIPETFHHRIFKMFQTLKPRDQKEGSGLGLSIVKKLVEWQGGKIWVTASQDGRGTEIHFTWPKQYKQEEVKNAA